MKCYLDGHDKHREVAFEEADAMFFDDEVAHVVNNTVANDAANVLSAFLSQVEGKQLWFFNSGAYSHLNGNNSLLKSGWLYLS